MVAVLGLVLLVGSGGGFGVDIGPLSTCPREDRSSVVIDPQRAVVAAGDSISFTARPDFPADSYSWSRCRQGRCVEVAVHSHDTLTDSDTFTLAAVSLEDDGSTVGVVADGCWWLAKGSARVEVLASPGASYVDAEFRPAEWETTVLPGEAGASTQTFTQSDTGGNPGTFGGVGYAVVSPAAELRVFHGSLGATYDPPSRGAVYAVDFALDCRVDRSDGGALTPPRKAFAQAGRWYQARSVPSWQGCDFGNWTPALDRTSLSLDSWDFELVAGSPCGPDEACPDFSAAGAPIRFGFVSGAARFPGAALGTVGYGIDNWRVTVWTK